MSDLTAYIRERRAPPHHRTQPRTDGFPHYMIAPLQPQATRHPNRLQRAWRGLRDFMRQPGQA